MPELIMVMVITGILSAYAIPKVTSVLSIRDDTWRDEVLASLRFAQKSAVARRRLICVTFTATTVTVTSAPANPAVNCAASVAGFDGNTTFATAGNSSANTAVTTSNVIYFQPDGRATTDGAGTTASDRVITMANVSSITVYGETGHVR